MVVMTIELALDDKKEMLKISTPKDHVSMCVCVCVCISVGGSLRESMYGCRTVPAKEVSPLPPSTPV